MLKNVEKKQHVEWQKFLLMKSLLVVVSVSYVSLNICMLATVACPKLAWQNQRCSLTLPFLIIKKWSSWTCNVFSNCMLDMQLCNLHFWDMQFETWTCNMPKMYHVDLKFFEMHVEHANMENHILKRKITFCGLKSGHAGVQADSYSVNDELCCDKLNSCPDNRRILMSIFTRHTTPHIRHVVNHVRQW